MTRREIHAVVQQAYDLMIGLYGKCDDVSSDSAFAIGEALGVLGKAKALVGRDIDAMRKEATDG